MKKILFHTKPYDHFLNLYYVNIEGMTYPMIMSAHGFQQCIRLWREAGYTISHSAVMAKEIEDAHQPICNNQKQVA